MLLRKTAKGKTKFSVNIFPDLNPLMNLWLDLTRAVHSQSPCNLTESGVLMCDTETHLNGLRDGIVDEAASNTDL